MLKALARFHAHFSEAARRPRPDEKWRCGGHWQPAYQNAEQFERGVEDAWPRLLDNFRSVLEASPATRDLELETLGGRVQRAAVAAGREAHPFAHDDVTDVEEWRTLIHGDLKAANVLVKGGETVALLDFQYVGDGLAVDGKVGVEHHRDGSRRCGGGPYRGSLCLRIFFFAQAAVAFT